MPHKLKKLEPKHHIAVRLKVEGKTNDQIAKEIGVRRATVNSWMTQELIKEAIDSLQDRIGEVFAEKIASSGLQTLDVMKQMLEMPIRAPDGDGPAEYLTFDQRMQIIDRFLDRNPHTARVQNGNGEGGEGAALPPHIQATLNLISGKNPAELVEMLQAIVGGKGAPSITAPPAAIEAPKAKPKKS